MKETKKVKCAWCGNENIPNLIREKSEYTNIVMRRCSLCNKVLASYLDEKGPVLEKVRTFHN